MNQIHTDEIYSTTHLLHQFITKYQNSPKENYVEQLIEELDSLHIEYESGIQAEFHSEVLNWYRDLKVLWKAREIIEGYFDKVKEGSWNNPFSQNHTS
jgi:hypothetical protein